MAVAPRVPAAASGRVANDEDTEIERMLANLKSWRGTPCLPYSQMKRAHLHLLENQPIYILFLDLTLSSSHLFFSQLTVLFFSRFSFLYIHSNVIQPHLIINFHGRMKACQVRFLFIERERKTGEVHRRKKNDYFGFCLLWVWKSLRLLIKL